MGLVYDAYTLYACAPLVQWINGLNGFYGGVYPFIALIRCTPSKFG
jgi:hypothetical protein